MPQVSVTEVIDRPLKLVWRTVLDVGSHPERMKSVRASRVLEYAARDDGTIEALMSWEVELENAIHGNSSQMLRAVAAA